MSRYAESRYEIERRRRQELFEQRVRETTRTYLERYERVVADVRAQGLAEYVKDELSSIERELSSLSAQVASDPAAARDRSVSLGNRVHALPRLARGMKQAAIAAQRAAEEAEREAERLRIEKLVKAREEIENLWQSELSAWTDSFARQLAFKELAGLRARIAKEGASLTLSALRSSLTEIKERFEQESRLFRERETESASTAAAEDEIAICREQLQQVSGPAAQRAQEIFAKLKEVEKGSSAEISARLVESTRELDDAQVSESCRREVVQAVYRALEDAGFVTERPKIVREDGANEVVIHGRRPAGAQAVFRVELSGKLNYKFDQYQGSACKKDIATVLPRLQSVYGIQLSNDRVIWENPDDVDADARPQPSMTKGR